MLVTIVVTAALARAGEITVDINSLLNEPWTFQGPAHIINPSTLPVGDQNFGGVPFTIPTGPNNFRLGAAVAGFRPGTVGLTVPVGVQGVTSVFAPLNTFWSQPELDKLSASDRNTPFPSPESQRRFDGSGSRARSLPWGWLRRGSPFAFPALADVRCCRRRL